MIGMKAVKQLIGLILLLVLSGMSCLAEQPDKDIKTSSVIAVDEDKGNTEIQGEKRKSGWPRLKYRNGPVCMCNDGLSEADIQSAWMKRFPQVKDSE